MQKNEGRTFFTLHTKINHANSYQKVVRDKEGHYIMIKRPILKKTLQFLIRAHLTTELQNT